MTLERGTVRGAALRTRGAQLKTVSQAETRWSSRGSAMDLTRLEVGGRKRTVRPRSAPLVGVNVRSSSDFGLKGLGHLVPGYGGARRIESTPNEPRDDAVDSSRRPGTALQP